MIKKKVMKTSVKEVNEEHKRYRWFITSTGRLVYGGKNAEQNEEIIMELLKEKRNRIIMHTKIAGSPFAIINEDPLKVQKEGLDEVAIWTACFSRAWREGLSKVEVHVFLTEQVFKKPQMSTGTFGVMGKIDKLKAELKLALVKQRGVFRAVPFSAAKGKKYSVIVPGKVSKDKFAERLASDLKVEKDEILNALPTGSFKEISE